MKKAKKTKKAKQRETKSQIKVRKQKRRKAQDELRKHLAKEGLEAMASPSVPNRKSDFQDIDEEREARRTATIEKHRVIASMLPGLLENLSKIKDFRNPKKIKHKMTVLMTYGILCFVHNMSSRREANQEMTLPSFMESLHQLFPEITKLPHHDTLKRLLSGIDVEKIQEAHVKMIRRLIRNKKFERYLIDGCYGVAVDGTQKMVRRELLDEGWLQREVKKGKGTQTQYYVYVLEANLIFNNGMVIPFLSEVLEYHKGDTSNDKQDCEQRAFQRLAKRLKLEFPKLSFMMLLDGLYPNGPVMDLLRAKNWDYMIVLQDDSLKSVWEEYEGLKGLQGENQLERNWGNRRQHFRWVNHIEYRYGPNERKRVVVHLVTCEETWEEIDAKTNKPVTKKSFHAWLSRKPLSKSNVHERCNIGARHRWGIENGFLIEKHHGYQYEHCFSTDWNAMKGYHYLMRIGHALNVLIQYTEVLYQMVRTMGVRMFIRFVRNTMTGLWLDAEDTRSRMNHSFQLRLV
jgi:hypothetical protein